MPFESLPVELIAEILSELDLESLIKLSYLSKRIYLVASDSALNPWRRPILRNLRSHTYEDALKHLSVRITVPRQNWSEVLTLARPSFILYEATLPNLKSAEWEECFNRRFLPGWRKWKKDGGTWREGFMKTLYRVWHRSRTSCTIDEAWTKYIVLNRNGTANQLEVSSRNFNPFVVFNEMKLQSNLMHLETRIRPVLELADVRILAFGTLNRPKTTFTVNPNAHIFLHPPGIEAGEARKGRQMPQISNFIEDHGVYPMVEENIIPSYLSNEYHMPYTTYTRLAHPLPAPVHANYPFYTTGGGDRRWGQVEEEDLHWVGGMMIIAQILGPPTHDADGAAPGTHQYASFTWSDLWAIAPWLEERITSKIDGAGLGHD